MTILRGGKFDKGVDFVFTIFGDVWNGQ
jgi:hypothetical protein